MKRIYLYIITLMLCINSHAQSNMYICKGISFETYPVSTLGTMSFSSNGEMVNIGTKAYNVGNIDSIVFVKPDYGTTETQINVAYNSIPLYFDMTPHSNFVMKSDCSWLQTGMVQKNGTNKLIVNPIFSPGKSTRTGHIYVVDNSYKGSLVTSASSTDPYAAAADTVLSKPDGTIYTFTVVQGANMESEVSPRIIAAYIDNGLNIKFHSGKKQGNISIECTGCTGNLPKMPWATWNKLNTTSVLNLNVTDENNLIKIHLDNPSDYTLPNGITIGGTLPTWKVSDNATQGTAQAHFTLNGKIYYGGGMSSYLYDATQQGLSGTYITTEFSNDFHCYNPANSTITDMNDLPLADSCATAKVGNNVYLIYPSCVYKYNSATDTWTLHKEQISRNMCDAFTIGEKIYLINEATTEVYDQSFQLLSTIPNPISFKDVTTNTEENGSVWVSAKNTYLYTFVNDTYTLVSESAGRLIGAYNGCAYIYNYGIKKIDNNGTLTNMQTFYNTKNSDGNSFYPYGVMLDGKSYILGGIQTGTNPNPTVKVREGHNKTFHVFDIANYEPIRPMIVTQ